MITRIYECPLYKYDRSLDDCVNKGNRNFYNDNRLYVSVKHCIFGREICHIDIDTDVCNLDYREIYDMTIKAHNGISETENRDLLKICYELDS